MEAHYHVLSVFCTCIFSDLDTNSSTADYIILSRPLTHGAILGNGATVYCLVNTVYNMVNHNMVTVMNYGVDPLHLVDSSHLTSWQKMESFIKTQWSN